jgi:ABC-type multidrug transport system permease subunit
MSSLEKSNDSEAETLRNMGINIAVIFGVIAALIVVSIYLAGASN